MLDDAVKETIQTAYRDFLAGKGIRARYGQRLMVAEIARYLGEITQSDGARTSAPATCVVEAGTGTGKTLAYLLAAIPVAKSLGKRLVLSTATVALQDQIVGKDLPDVRQHTGLDFSWTLAKGRGRYLCLSRLEGRLHDEGVADSESMPLFLLEDAPTDQGEDRAFYEKLLSSYATQTWDGDRDHWPEAIEDDRWRRITTDHRGCTNRHCAYFDSCAFFAARGALEEADVIVSNHDLILADLALGGGAILPKPEDTIYIFDEAHHLPEKALSHFAASTGLNGARNWLKQVSQVLAKMLPHLSPGTTAARCVERISTAARNQDPLLETLYDWLAVNLDWGRDGDSRQQIHRFPEGRLPEEFAAQVQALVPEAAQVCRELDTLADLLNKGLGDRPDGEVDRTTAESWYPVIGQLHARSEEQVQLWKSFAADLAEHGPPPARWVQRQQWDRGEELTLYTSPVLADHLLSTRLWSRSYGAILTSATLTALGSFDRLTQRAGLPPESRFLVAPPAFRYHDMATVEVPPQALEPGDSAAYTEALVRDLPGLWQQEKAILVLFTARRQMHAVRDALAADVAVDVSTQDDHARAVVLQNHRERIDAGKRSVLFGVASFAEGIDLPGHYLEHVIITRLPFSVPDDPIEASLAEWITQRGGNPFMEISVPDASIRLVQAAGRLLRTEEDRGRITILDRRILTRRYGSLLLDALPPFRRVFG